MLAMLLCQVWLLNTPARAESRPLAGHWRRTTNTSISLGIVQSGQTLFLLSDRGYAVALLSADAEGAVASGSGKWTLAPDQKAVDVSVRVGEMDGHLYLWIKPQGAGTSQEIKVRLTRVTSAPRVERIPL